MAFGTLGSTVGFLCRDRASLLRLMINAGAVARVPLLEALFTPEGIRHIFVQPTFSPAIIFLFLFSFGVIGMPFLLALFLP